MEKEKFHIRLQQTIGLLFGLWLMVGCGSGQDSRPNIKNIKVSPIVFRFDRDMAKLDTAKIEMGLMSLKKKYPEFLDFYLDNLMGFGIREDYADTSAGIRLGLRPFLAHPDIRALFDTVDKHFPNVDAPTSSLIEGFKYVKYYFPHFKVPTIVYFISGLNQWSAITLDSSLVGVGLDMYLGSQYPFYKAVQIPQYVIRKCSPEYISTNVFQAIFRDWYPVEMEDKNLLQLMLQRGKEQWFLAHILPNTPDSIRLGFTAAQLSWCEKNEALIYNFFIAQNLLYETSPNKVYRFVFDGPSTTGMPAESPGNIGTWLGYRILQAYAEMHPKVDFQQILSLPDAQKILQDSKYKPH
ncbi:MAG: hypothetical protein JSS64_11800 [Bacteroidetes bacterium]|nr:hypothetical protein [Bacteroidota bacterium]